MIGKEFPKITFGIIVLNGEPFVRYCLRSIYPFAYEIIVVEGGHEDAKSVCTEDGHSVDGTLDTLNKFKREEDKDNKLIIITRDGFWPKKDELGNDRTPQSRAYSDRATGDYLWQIDIDEFYKEEDMLTIINILKRNGNISVITFPTYTFWGDINYAVDSWSLRRGDKYVHRLFKWSVNYKYLTHEPPTVIDEKGVDLRKKGWLSGKRMKRKKIFMYHYSLLFPWQVEQKVKIYRDEKPEVSEMVDWAQNNYFQITNPFNVHNVYMYPGWLSRFKKKHPKQIIEMMTDIKEGRIQTKLRQIADIEMVLSSRNYKLKCMVLKIKDPLNRLGFQLLRVKNIPNRINKIISKYSKTEKVVY